MRSEINDGKILNYYIPQYYPGDRVLDHVAFGLKHEGLDLNLLQKVFGVLPPKDVADYINETPTGRYARQIGFLYEFLTGTEVEGVKEIAGNYVDVADSELYYTPQNSTRNVKWRINNNLPGGPAFCPLIRKTEILEQYRLVDFGSMIDQTLADVPADIFSRAINYFYFKETKSSNDIERETPDQKREQLFVDLLKTAGQTGMADRLSEKSLTLCQNAITDPRYNADGFRLDQNYVGETTAYGRHPIIHLAGLPPEYLQETMAGLAQFAERTHGMNPVLRAACISFCFVFIHPFADGNGRVHRFLINDVLANDKLLQRGVILPISAIMLRKHREYDEALESFSKPLMAEVAYELDTDERLTVVNGAEVAGYYKFPDMTRIAEYLFQVVDLTISHELASELKLIRAFDQFRSDIRDIVDLPSRELELIIKLIHQGNGRLSKVKREKFDKISDDEVSRIEDAYKDAMRRNENSPSP